MVHRENLYYKTNKYTHNFQNFQTISTFGRDICNSAITAKKADDDQSDLLVKILNYRKQVKPKNSEEKQQQKDVLKNYIIFSNVEKEFLMFWIGKNFQKNFNVQVPWPF